MSTTNHWHPNALHPSAPPPPSPSPPPSSDPQQNQPQQQQQSNVSQDTPPAPFAFDQKSNSTARSVHVEVYLDRTLHVASGWVEGVITVDVGKEKKVKIGKVEVEVVGFEETLRAKNKTHPIPRRTLLHHTLTIQSHHFAPTDLVHPGPPDEHGMWNARKGKVSLPFKLPIGALSGKGENEMPEGAENVMVKVGAVMPLPGSFWSKKYGGVRYIVAGTVHTKFGRFPHPPIRAYRDLRVVESTPYALLPRFASRIPPTAPFIAEAAGSIPGPYWFGLGKQGRVGVKANVRVPEVDETRWMGQNPNVDGAWIAGGVGFVGVDIRNDSKRRVDSLTLTLVRRLKTFSLDSPATGGIGATSAPSPTLLPISFARVPIATRTFRAGRGPLKSGRWISDSKVAGDGWAEEDGGALAKGVGDGGDGVHARKGKEWWNGVGPGEERSVLVDMHVPVHARSIRFGMLLDVSYVVQVSVHTKGSKNIELEIPVTVLHPASLYTNLPPVHLGI
ncbi:hypothetical protein HK104_004536, partial [Borealophlyctis nickersoniae]